MSGSFVDTNILVYAYLNDPRTETAASVLSRRPVISVQILNEFLNVCRRKLRFDWDRADDALADILLLCPHVMPLKVSTHMTARLIAERYQLSTYDSVAIASALEADCATFFSEDMQDGLVIDDRLTVRNPFA